MRATSRNSKNKTTRTIALFVTICLLAFAVIQLPMLADQWEELKSQIAHQRELENGYGIPGSSPALMDQLREVEAELGKLNASMIDSSMLPNIQSELIELLRESGCKIRKVAIQTGSAESWESYKPQVETPLEEISNDPKFVPDPANLIEEATTYTLNTERISLSLTGTLDQVLSFFKKLRQKEWILRVAQMSFSHTPDDNGSLAVETTVAFLRLVRSEPEGELVKWREGSRANQTN
jgi:hypothetical protein